MFSRNISVIVEDAFEAYGLDRQFGRIKPSDRPDLSDYQCNGAFQAAKALKQNPRQIAEEIKSSLIGNNVFDAVTVDGPGFLNFKINDQHILEKLSEMRIDFFSKIDPKKIVIDYGGPNVAKPLHVGHLRSAIIGESLKRTARFIGHEVIADIHLGDWGTPMGMLLAELERINPAWPYFSDSFTDSEVTSTPPLTAEELNELYPLAAKRFKEDDKFAELARDATAKLQAGHIGYRALWKHFVDLSVESIKEDFGALGVDFDLWLGESDADPYIEEIIDDLISRGVARESNGAVIIDVKREGDNQDIPPLMLKKSNGAVTYATTDLATIFQRVQDYAPDHILYVVDQRQSLHFLQVFRAAAKAGYIAEDKLEHIGFGTMNGKDGKPFKTREGGVMRLSDLIGTSQKLAERESGFAEEAQSAEIEQMLHAIAISAIKFGDLSNPRTSDYIFDPDEFVRFEGKTGPYMQYAAVRANAILERFDIENVAYAAHSFPTTYERDLALHLLEFQEAIEASYNRRMPSDMCDYVYSLARSFNSFYKHCNVIAEDDPDIKESRLALASMTKDIIGITLDLLAIPVPTRMLRAEVSVPSIV